MKGKQCKSADAGRVFSKNYFEESVPKGQSAINLSSVNMQESEVSGEEQGPF